MASKIYHIPIVSRRELRKLCQENQNLSKSSLSSKKSFGAAEESSWPRSLQIAGYTAVALSIPYSICTYISESPQLRSRLEGDVNPKTDHDSLNVGRNIVRWVRMYWGKEEDVPYSSRIGTNVEEGKKKETPLSFQNEASSKIRNEQVFISQMINSSVNVEVSKGVGEDYLKGSVPGTVNTRDYNLIWSYVSGRKQKENRNDQHGLRNLRFEFQNEEKENIENPFIEDSNTMMNSDYLETKSLEESTFDLDGEMLRKLTTTWSFWNYFPTSINSNLNKPESESSRSDLENKQLQPQIAKMEWSISELQKSLNDPLCTKDRDDMQQELEEIRKEMFRLKRERRLSRVRSWFYR